MSAVVDSKSEAPSMSLSIWLGSTLALVLFGVVVWNRRRQRRVRSTLSTRSGSYVRPPKRAALPNASGVLIYINDDGSARELTETDKKYVDTEFSPLDGARPYIKSHYSQRTALGELRGYLQRTEVPDGVPIDPAPPESAARQQTPQTVADSISELILRHNRN
jgi:hypothetical protein